MHSCIYHFPFAPRLYKVNSVSVNDILSICNPVFQIRVNIDWEPLTLLPVTVDDIVVEWEQLSGPEPLEFVTKTKLEPGVVADSDIIEDMVFRLWIDKGTDYEMYTDMTVYRTPTDLAASNGSINYNYTPRPLKVTGDTGTGNPYHKLLGIKSVTTIPDISSTYTGGGVIKAEDLSVFSAIIDYSELLYLSKHKVTGLRAYDPSTGALLSSSTQSDIINIPMTATVFYLVFELTLNYYDEHLSNRVIKVSDNMVRSSYYKEHQRDLKTITLYVTEGVFKNTPALLEGVDTNNKQLEVSLPQILSFVESKATPKIQINETTFSNRNVSKYKPIALDTVPDERRAIPKVTIASNTHNVETLTVDRFLGISIGG